ncbi:MAG: hypothetical protein HY908_22420 [Myxococcales bacterium]|nr:hypothetical protein [Myxococcales bacterium]
MLPKDGIIEAVSLTDAARVTGKARGAPAMPAKIVLVRPVAALVGVVLACDLRGTPAEPALPRASASTPGAGGVPRFQPVPSPASANSWEADEPVAANALISYRLIHGRVVVDDASLGAWPVLGVRPAGSGCGELMTLELHPQLADASMFWELAPMCGGVVSDLGGGRFRVCRRFPVPACASAPSSTVDACAGDFYESFFRPGVHLVGWCGNVGLYARPLSDAGGICIFQQFEAGGLAMRVGRGRFVVVEGRDWECSGGHWSLNEGGH